MGANQNSSRNLAYIPESTQIHITQNPAVLKPRLAVEHRSKNEKNQQRIGLKKIKNSGREIVVRARVLLFGKMEPTTSNRGASAAMGQGGEASRRSSRRKPRRYEKTGHAGDPATRTSRDLSHRATAVPRRRTDRTNAKHKPRRYACRRAARDGRENRGEPRLAAR
jgi:hypothetical protein